MRFSSDQSWNCKWPVLLCCRYWYDRKSAAKVDQRIQKGLFMFAVTNSCMNPIVYGAFNIRVRRAAQVSSSRLRQPDTVTTSGVPQSHPACTYLGSPLSRDPFFNLFPLFITFLQFSIIKLPVPRVFRVLCLCQYQRFAFCFERVAHRFG